jgi:hypothetical protein
MGTHCDKLVDSGRRKFLTGASVAVVSAATSTIVAPQARAESGARGVVYPSNRLGNVHDLKLNEPLNVAYPDSDAPGVLIKLGTRVPSGVNHPSRSTPWKYFTGDYVDAIAVFVPGQVRKGDGCRREVQAKSRFHAARRDK